MGIKHLNKFIKTNCSECLTTISLKDLSDKEIAIDASIYLYRFISEDCLIENIYLMNSLFKKYNITPIFVFDGKPPPEKQQILMERKIKKAEAKVNYEQYKKQLNNIIDPTERHEIDIEMTKLKRRFICIKNDQIRLVKELLTSMGVYFIEAEGEADNLCAWLTIKHKVYACLSEDMDMFVFGCPRILRYFSIYKERMILYNTKKILKKLRLTQSEFRELCVLSGSDYNKSIENNEDKNNKDNDKIINNKITTKINNKIHRKTIFDYYKMFNNNRNKNNCDYIYDKNETIDYNEMLRICDLFDVNKLDNKLLFGDKDEYRHKIDRKKNNNFRPLSDKLTMRNILLNNGFIFLN